MSDTCATCNGTCCYNVVVRVTGYDAWRIKRAQALEFGQFLYTQPDDPPMPGGFVVGCQRLAIYLGKSAERPNACAFLMHFPGDVKRCGIYEERPRVCAVYPMTFRNGSVALRDDVQCKPTNWNMATITYPRWRGALLRHHFETLLYERVAAHWNDRHQNGKAALADYYAYVERCFDGIDATIESIDHAEFDELVLHWQDASPNETQRVKLGNFFERVDEICGGADR